MAKKEQNENYCHSCASEKVCMADHILPLSCADYTADEFKRLIEFFVLCAPVLKSDSKSDYGLKSLKEYGWCGNSDMSKLERKLLKVSEIPMFCFIRSSSISGTLKEMELDGNICVEHPRAVLLQEHKITVAENEQLKLENSETRMECLFRHIRNAIAHSRTYVFENGFILLEDCDDKNKLTARILVKQKTLLDWIDVVSSQKTINTDPAVEILPQKPTEQQNIA